MSDEEATRTLLAGADMRDWRRESIAGDASDRQYQRLSGPNGRTAILMSCGVAGVGGLIRFARWSDYLRKGGLCAPAVLARDEANGLAIVEDLGCETFSDWVDRRPEDGPLLLAAAVDTLVQLGRLAVPEGPDSPDRLGPVRGAAMIAPFFDWYCPGIDTRDRAAIIGLVQVAMAEGAPGQMVFSLRDCHAANLIWRPGRQGVARVGLLDFQDAVLAPPEYDLASLLRDVRRDVSSALQGQMILRFAQATGRDPQAVRRAVAVLAVQRNLRILGIFARLAGAGAKPAYLTHMPRIRRLLEEDLAHPALTDLRRALTVALPPDPVPG